MAFKYFILYIKVPTLNHKGLHYVGASIIILYELPSLQIIVVYALN